ncbi:MAG: hypothetical protein A2W19_08375 [Spirochaetes bacterium RBG_16_49_21]|nr:MAG: hypothetical protein A2W19_08375 [Spirochaetes bacterium RBG_16_49_21]
MTLYVWQNIEIMKIGLQYQKLSDIEEQIVKDNDHLRYEIELYRRMEVVQDYARRRGFKPVLPEDFDVMAVDENNAQQ